MWLLAHRHGYLVSSSSFASFSRSTRPSLKNESVLHVQDVFYPRWSGFEWWLSILRPNCCTVVPPCVCHFNHATPSSTDCKFLHRDVCRIEQSLWQLRYCCNEVQSSDSSNLMLSRRFDVHFLPRHPNTPSFVHENRQRNHEGEIRDPIQQSSHAIPNPPHDWSAHSTRHYHPDFTAVLLPLLPPLPPSSLDPQQSGPGQHAAGMETLARRRCRRLRAGAVDNFPHGSD